jgi:hypothetical protein
VIGPRLRRRELFSLLGYEPHAGQLLVHRSKARNRTLACGTRWPAALAVGGALALSASLAYLLHLPAVRRELRPVYERLGIAPRNLE